MSDERENKKGWSLPVLDKGYVRLVDFMGSDQRIVESARISYNSPSKGIEQDNKLLEYLWKNLHLSPFEQVQFTFNIKLPIFIQRQLIRHRTFKINEVSARYTELPSDFYIPQVWRKQNIKNKQGSVDIDDWNPILYTLYEQGGMGGGAPPINYDATKLLTQHCENSYKLYQQMIGAGIAREMARMVLPVNIYTEIYVTCDLRNLLNFIRLREDVHAQFEIREYSNAIKYIVSQICPHTIEVYDKFKFKMVDLFDPPQ